MTAQQGHDAAVDTSTRSADLEPATYNAFVDGLELAGIELVRVHGERAEAGAAAQTRFDMSAGYMRDGGVIHYRYDLTAHFTDDRGTALGSAAASVLITARAAAAEDAASIEQFGGTSGALMAHPYLREAIASTALRIGFPGVLLPLIKHQPDATETD